MTTAQPVCCSVSPTTRSQAELLTRLHALVHPAELMFAALFVLVDPVCMYAP
jgi:hypothetical protein